MKSAVLILVSLWLSTASGRRLTSRSVENNEIDLNELTGNVVDDWVRIQTPQSEIRAEYGKIVDLKCNATGGLPPYVEFLRNTPNFKDGIISNEVSDIRNPAIAIAFARIRFVAKKTEVVYCRAISGNKIAQTPIRIVVTPPTTKLRPFGCKTCSPTITFWYDAILDTIGNSVTLPCAATGAGDITKTWYNATYVPIVETSNDRFTITPSGDLRIKNLHWSDMGGYTCFAKNSYGQDSILTFLYPMAPEE
ncbi:hypothetical protein MML48_9g00003307 [Holotrichia oblita]|uniref:Uncharacterized protein n=1 Tax=Holotrichia oblita TaxID=644536 RepID=A0ACB9SIB3_HOLOL|nr:hypothetical protein MML48_9g00003307 [Holotrichia oblita]